MSENKQPYDVLVAEEYTDRQSGEVKTSWNRVGVAFKNKDGETFSIIPAAGLAITGKCIIQKRKDREDA